MIKTVSVKIPKQEIFDSKYIENQLNKQFKDIIRWAIIEIDNDFLNISVSYLVHIYD